MKGNDLWPEISSTSVTVSVKQLVRTLQELTISVYPGHERQTSRLNGNTVVKPCRPQKGLNRRLEELISTEASPVFEAHKHHLDLQREKCPLDEDFSD